jgi:HrpA-like RNA helicase
MIICPLYAKLPPHLQQKVFQRTPPNFRKFILSTNVAETSITIPGVSYVIDTGFAKVKRFHSMAGVEELRAEPISQSSANQRTGRAGREVKSSTSPPQILLKRFLLLMAWFLFY